MKNFLFSEDCMEAVGIYDSFDSTVQTKFSVEEHFRNLRPKTVAHHEITHFFQNYFTLQGISLYSVVRSIEANTEDLLLDMGIRLPQAKTT